MKQIHFILVNVSEIHFGPCMSNNGEMHTAENIPLVFSIRAVDPRRLVHMRLLEYLEDEMFWNIKCLILVMNCLLQRVKKFKRNILLLDLIFPKFK